MVYLRRETAASFAYCSPISIFELGHAWVTRNPAKLQNINQGRSDWRLWGSAVPASSRWQWCRLLLEWTTFKGGNYPITSLNSRVYFFLPPPLMWSPKAIADFAIFFSLHHLPLSNLFVSSAQSFFCLRVWLWEKWFSLVWGRQWPSQLYEENVSCN